MTTLTVQVGQCGNQLGSAFFDALSANLSDDANSLKRDVFFDHRDCARAVLIDMEPKVVDRCLNRGQIFQNNPANIRKDRQLSWSYDRHSAFTQESGAGNNWAFGFKHFGPATESAISDSIRHQLEISDRTDAVLLLKSTAGGTGSGVGAYIQRLLIGNFEIKYPIMTIELWPFIQGEVCVQAYNTALSLSASQEFSDLLVAFENSTMQEICQSRLNIQKPGFDDINKLVASHLVHQMIPTVQGGGTSSLVQHLACLPQYKIATSRYLPQTASTAVNFQTDEWKGLFSGLGAMLRSGRVVDFDRRLNSQSNRILVANVCIRGSNPNVLDLKTVLKDRDFFCRAALDPIRVLVEKTTNTFQGHSKTVSVLAVDQHPVSMMETMVKKASSMLASNAYVHQYEQHGIEKEQLADAIFNFHETVERYKALTFI